MTGSEWGFFTFLLLLAVPLAWLEIRHMARDDGSPEEEAKWPEWWVRDSLESREPVERVRKAA